MRGVDYSWSRPGGAAIKAAGYEFAVRYVDYPGAAGKGIDANELADLRQNGLAVGFVFESTAGRMLEGGAAGAYDAGMVAQAFSQLGVPGNVPCYFACDTDIRPDQYPVLDDYLRGAASVLGAMRVGVYGEYDLIEHCHDVATAAWYWQTVAWSYSRRSQWCHIYQDGGTDFNGGADTNEAYGTEQGFWKPEDNDMSQAELDILTLSTWGATGEQGLTPEQRLVNAKWRANNASQVNGAPLAGTLGDLAWRIAQLPTGNGIDPVALAAEFSKLANLLSGGQA